MSRTTDAPYSYLGFTITARVTTPDGKGKVTLPGYNGIPGRVYVRFAPVGNLPGHTAHFAPADVALRYDYA